MKRIPPSQNILTIFNALTGLRQHTGNWPGKTVVNAQGYCEFDGMGYVVVDLPGCYSLTAHSAEEEAARDFICCGKPDAVIVVCDATCLERNMNLTLQILEITMNVVVCVNLMDEAAKKSISIDLGAISARLGVPVVGTAAGRGQGLDELMRKVGELVAGEPAKDAFRIAYPDYIELAVARLVPLVGEHTANAGWFALKLLESGDSFKNGDEECTGNILRDGRIADVLREVREELAKNNITEETVRDTIVSSLVMTAEELCRDTVILENKAYKESDIKIDRLLTGKRTAFPIMFLALMVIFWITISGANYTSQLISAILFGAEARLLNFLVVLGAPKFLCEMLVLGVYRVLAWVVAVMLPPMTIFFPMFTLLEDVGYLPRVAFNLDGCFKKCNACGKQALTMCMVDNMLRIFGLL